MCQVSAQRLRILPGQYVVEHVPGARAAPPGADWLALVRAPEGLTVIRHAPARTPDAWAALYSGYTAHGLDLPGMLAALLVPLRDSGVPVFVASTYHADVVLVPVARQRAAVAALRDAGHHVEAD